MAVHRADGAQRRLVGASVGGVAGALLLASTVAASPALANYPEPPEGGVSVQAYRSEVAPAGCPTYAPSGTIRTGGDVHAICVQASNSAPTREAAGAIRYAFAHLGAAYSQSNRDSVNPWVFDCSSMVGRAYRAAGGKIKNYRTGSVSSFYPMMGWTGAYIPSYYSGTNLTRVSKANLRPGDIIIQFDGPDPSQSAGNAGHAQIYLGGGRIIQSGGGRPSNLNVSSFGNYSFSNAWYFHYNSLGGTPPPVTGGGSTTSRVTPWKYPFYLGRVGTKRIMNLQVLPGANRVLQLQWRNPKTGAWQLQSSTRTRADGTGRFGVPFRAGKWWWRLYAPATASEGAAAGPQVAFIGM